MTNLTAKYILYVPYNVATWNGYMMLAFFSRVCAFEQYQIWTGGITVYAHKTFNTKEQMLI